MFGLVGCWLVLVSSSCESHPLRHSVLALILWVQRCESSRLIRTSGHVKAGSPPLDEQDRTPPCQLVVVKFIPSFIGEVSDCCGNQHRWKDKDQDSAL